MLRGRPVIAAIGRRPVKSGRIAHSENGREGAWAPCDSLPCGEPDLVDHTGRCFSTERIQLRFQRSARSVTVFCRLLLLPP